MRVVRTPAIARSLFTANQLSGWPNGIAYAPRRRKPKPKRLLIDGTAAVNFSAKPIQAGILAAASR